MNEKLLKLKDVTELLQVSRATIYRLVKKEEFPDFIKIGGGSYWKASDIQKFLENAQAKNKTA